MIDKDKIKQFQINTVTGARALLRSAAPYIRAAHHVANVAVHVKNPSLVGVGAVAATAVSVLQDLFPERWKTTLTVPVGTKLLFEGLIELGAIEDPSTFSSLTAINRRVHKNDIIFCNQLLHGNSENVLSNKPLEEIFPLIVEALDRVLPNRMALGGDGNVLPFQSKLLPSDFGLALIDRLSKANINRAILLKGRPGAGKTTLAHFIADKLARNRRIIQLQNTWLGSPINERTTVQQTYSPERFRQTLRMLSAHTIIVDELNHVKPDLQLMEVLTQSVPLVIYVANTGPNDPILDAATIRPKRIDEVHTVKIVTVPLDKGTPEPFNHLPSETWKRIKAWPIAALNEVDYRIRTYGITEDSLQLEELEERVNRKCQSEGL